MQKNYKTFVGWIVWAAIIIFLVIHFVIRSYPKGNPWELETLAGDIGYTVTKTPYGMTWIKCINV